MQLSMHKMIDKHGACVLGAVLGIFIWVGQSKAKESLGRPTGVVYEGIIYDPRRLGRPGTSLGSPRPTRPNS